MKKIEKFPIHSDLYVKVYFYTVAFIYVVIVQAKGPITLEPSCHTIGVSIY